MTQQMNIYKVVKNRLKLTLLQRVTTFLRYLSDIYSINEQVPYACLILDSASTMVE